MGLFLRLMSRVRGNRQEPVAGEIDVPEDDEDEVDGPFAVGSVDGAQVPDSVIAADAEDDDYEPLPREKTRFVKFRDVATVPAKKLKRKPE